jgi:serine kinase of HPr protein (carbohydrate metabolism regulator)
MPALPTIHATAVSVKGQGVVLVGPPGSGKSDLALRLIDRGATLVADDRVHLDPAGCLHPPPTLAGLIEVRGLGILSMPHVAGIAARLLVDLSAAPERMPDPSLRTVSGIALPLLRLSAFEPSAPLKVELAVAHQVPKG